MDPTSGKTLWSRRDHRVKPDDMFVALEVANNHLFWCTNHGYFGFMSLAEASDADMTCSLNSGLDLVEELVSFPFKSSMLKSLEEAGGSNTKSKVPSSLPWSLRVWRKGRKFGNLASSIPRVQERFKFLSPNLDGEKRTE
jgi:hypothetical protein